MYRQESAWRVQRQHQSELRWYASVKFPNFNNPWTGAGGDENKSKNPTFVGKPRIMPKDGGALIVMECKVKSPTVPTAKWMKDGTPLTMGGLYHAIFSDLGDQTYLCQLEIRVGLAKPEKFSTSCSGPISVRCRSVPV